MFQSQQSADLISCLSPLTLIHLSWGGDNTTILTIIDRFSKAFILFLMKLASALETANLLVLHVFRLHSIPQIQISGRSGSPVHFSGVEVILPGSGGLGKSLIWFSPTDQWPDGADKPGFVFQPCLPAS